MVTANELQDQLVSSIDKLNESVVAIRQHEAHEKPEIRSRSYWKDRGPA